MVILKKIGYVLLLPLAVILVIIEPILRAIWEMVITFKYFEAWKENVFLLKDFYNKDFWLNIFKEEI